MTWTNSELEMMEKNVSVVRQFYHAMQAGQQQVAESFLDHDNFVLIEPQSLPYGGEWKGLAGFQKAMQTILNTWQPLGAKMLHYTAGDDLVTAHIHLEGTGKTGKSFSSPFLEVLRVHNGKIVEIRPFYWDTHHVRQCSGIDAT